MRQIVAFSFAGLCLGMLVPAARSAEADGGAARRSLAVVVLPSAELTRADQASVQDALVSAAFQHSGPDGAFRLTAFTPVPADDKEADRLQRAQRMVEEGKKYYRYLKLPKARATFEAAERILDHTCPARCDRRMVADLYFYWARATLDDGDQDGAQRLLARVSRFDPRAGPDPAVMPPNLVATFDLALDEHRSRPEVPVTVDVAPAQGTLYTDCRERAFPVTLKKRTGDHLWLALVGGQETFRGRFRIPQAAALDVVIFSGHTGENARIRDALQSAAGQKETLGSLQARPSTQLDQAAGLLSVDVLLVGEVVEEGGNRVVRLGLYVPGKGVMSAPARVALDASAVPDGGQLGGALEALARSLRSPTLLVAVEGSAGAQPPPPGAQPPPAGESTPPPGEDPARRGEENGSTPWYKTWWFWTAVGAVVAGGTVTGVLLATSNGGSSPSGKVVISILPP